MVVVTQQRGRKMSARARRRGTPRVLGQMRRRAARGVLGRIRLGTASSSPRLRRWALAVVLLGVVLAPYPTQGAAAAPPGRRLPGRLPGLRVRVRVRVRAQHDQVDDLAARVLGRSFRADRHGAWPSGLAYASVGDGVAAVGVPADRVRVLLNDWGIGVAEHADRLPRPVADIVSVRTWPGEVTAGVSYRPCGQRRTLPSAPRWSSPIWTGAQTGRYPAATFGGAVAGSPKYTVAVGAAAVTSYDNATGHVRRQRPTGQVAQAWRTDGNWLYVTESAYMGRGFGPGVTALRRIDLVTGMSLSFGRFEGLEFDGTPSTAFGGVVLFFSAAGVTAYSVAPLEPWLCLGTGS